MNHACGDRVRSVRYFFLFFEEVLVVLVEDEGLVVVVFLADEGFEARCLLDADGLAVAAAVFLEATVLEAALLTAFDKGSVFRDALAGMGSADAGAGGGFLAASRQFG